LRFASLQQPVGFSLRPHADWHSDQQPDELDAFASADARAFLLPERIAHDESDGDAHGHAIVRPERQPDRRADKAGLAVLKNQRRLVSRCRCVRRRCGSFSTHCNSSIFCAQRDKESRTGYAGPHRIADLGGNDDAHAVAYAWPHSPADCDSFARANAQCMSGIARLACRARHSARTSKYGVRTVVRVGASAADSQAHIIADKVRPAAVRPNYIGSASRADGRPIAAGGTTHAGTHRCARPSSPHATRPWGHPTSRRASRRWIRRWHRCVQTPL
jgi:hypothetical protein